MRTRAKKKPAAGTVTRIGGFWHIYTGPCYRETEGGASLWREIMEEQVDLLWGVDLYERFDVFRGVILGQEIAEAERLLSFLTPKLEVCYTSTERHEFEFPTLRLVHDWAREEPDGYSCYFHLKGAWRSDGNHPWPEVRDERQEWRDQLNHHVIENWQRAVAALDEGHDLAGCRWCLHGEVSRPTHGPHFSGNYWWARNGYLARLPAPDWNEDNTAAEMWVGKNPEAKVKELL